MAITLFPSAAIPVEVKRSHSLASLQDWRSKASIAFAQVVDKGMAAIDNAVLHTQLGRTQKILIPQAFYLDPAPEALNQNEPAVFTTGQVQNIGDALAAYAESKGFRVIGQQLNSLEIMREPEMQRPKV
jgi:hypothetical protein